MNIYIIIISIIFLPLLSYFICKIKRTLFHSYKNRYHILFNHSNEACAFWQKSKKNGNFKLFEANKVAKEVYDFDKHKFTDLFLTNIFAIPAPEIENYLERIINNEKLFIKTFIKKSDGKFFPVELKAYYLNLNNKPTIITHIKDITEQEKIQYELRKERDLIRSVMDTSPAGILLINPDGIITFVNSFTQLLFKKRREEIINKSIFSPDWKITDFEGKEIYEKDFPFFKALNTGKPVFDIPLAINFSQHERKLLLANASPLYQDPSYLSGDLCDKKNALSCIILVLVDVTERVKAEISLRNTKDQLHQAQKLDSVGRLAGGIAHDFNNLLTTILGYSDLIYESDINEHVKDFITEVIKTCKRASSLTQQLLAFSRNQFLHPSVIEINKLILELEKMLKRLIGEDIILITLLDPHTGCIKADPGQIEQVIMNLVVNSRDAMPQGGKIIIKTEKIFINQYYNNEYKIVKPGYYVQLIIQDTGIGMNQEILKNIFEPFFTTKTLGKGTGLGLSTVYGIIKQSGGYIFVESTPNQGTTFRILLPYTIKTYEKVETHELETKAIKGKETIMLVEDENDVRKMISRTIDYLGYCPIIAKNGKEALDIINNLDKKIDLLITDIVMPEMSGVKLVENLSKKMPQLKVLYMSGYADNVIENHSMNNKKMDFLPKPFSVNSLSKKIREILDN